MGKGNASGSGTSEARIGCLILLFPTHPSKNLFIFQQSLPTVHIQTTLLSIGSWKTSLLEKAIIHMPKKSELRKSICKKNMKKKNQKEPLLKYLLSARQRSAAREGAINTSASGFSRPFQALLKSKNRFCTRLSLCGCRGFRLRPSGSAHIFMRMTRPKLKKCFLSPIL